MPEKKTKKLPIYFNIYYASACVAQFQIEENYEKIVLRQTPKRVRLREKAYLFFK